MYFSGIDLHKDMSVITTINENGAILSQRKVPNHEAHIITYFNQVSPLGGYSGSFGQSFRKVSDTLFAPVQVKLV